MNKDFFVRSRWSLMDRVVAWLGSAAVLGWLALPIIGAAEGFLFPVVSRVELGRASPVPPPGYRTLWEAQAHKNRNCEFVAVEWWLVSGPNKVQVPADFTDPPTVRREGRLEWDGLRIWLSPSQMPETEAYVFHRCYLRPWLTRTRFY